MVPKRSSNVPGPALSLREAAYRVRANVAGLNLDNEAIRYLMDRVEGNLLAGAQEIENLKLIAGPDLMTVEDVESLIGDFAHYDVFSLIDAINIYTG